MEPTSTQGGAPSNPPSHHSGFASAQPSEGAAFRGSWKFQLCCLGSDRPARRKAAPPVPAAFAAGVGGQRGRNGCCCKPGLCHTAPCRSCKLVPSSVGKQEGRQTSCPPRRSAEGACNYRVSTPLSSLMRAFLQEWKHVQVPDLQIHPLQDGCAR